MSGSSSDHMAAWMGDIHNACIVQNVVPVQGKKERGVRRAILKRFKQPDQEKPPHSSTPKSQYHHSRKKTER
ncbi:hypothetical protein AAHA92_07241 [Salvia divinorum]|uniref:Uncharacterized protein n=1 Tax=Salvia divinorum TaxID=28513 RepID=A0ABD1I8A8_SALDI